MNIKVFIFFLIASLLTGCAAGIRGSGQPTHLKITKLSVLHNSRVTIPSFEKDLVDQLEQRNIKADIILSVENSVNPYVLEYSARRSTGMVSTVKFNLYKNNILIGHILWKAGRSPKPIAISDETYKSVEYWQTAEALAGLFGEITIE